MPFWFIFVDIIPLSHQVITTHSSNYLTMASTTISMDIERNILEYGFVSRGKEIIKINKIDKNDERYNMLGCIPKIKCIPNVDYWLDLPISNTKRQYYMQYACNYRKSYFYSSLLDYDVNKEDYDEDFEEGEPYEDIMYSYSISKNHV